MAITLTFQVSAVSINSANITVPGTAAAGDVAFLFDRARNSPTKIVPSGWSELFYDNTNGRSWVVSAKVLEAGDISSSVTGMNGSTNESKVMLIFRPSGGTVATPVAADIFAQDFQSSTGDPPNATVNPVTGETTPFILFGFYGTDDQTDTASLTNSPTLTEVHAGSGINCEATAGYFIVNTGGISFFNFGIGNEGTNNEVGGLVVEIKEYIVTASGTPTLSNITASGTLVNASIHTASGTPSLSAITSSGVAFDLSSAGGDPTWSFHASDTDSTTAASSISVTIPNTVNDGDLAVLYETGWYNSTQPSVPSGFTTAIEADATNSGGFNTDLLITMKKLTTGDRNVTINGTAAGSERHMILIILRPSTSDYTLPSAKNTAYLNSNGPVTAQTSSTTGSASPSVGFGFFGARSSSGGSDGLGSSTAAFITNKIFTPNNYYGGSYAINNSGTLPSVYEADLSSDLGAQNFVAVFHLNFSGSGTGGGSAPKVAFGNPTLSAVTSSGTATVSTPINTASGTPALTNITASGVGYLPKKTATGTPALTNITSAATVKLSRAASGAPTLSVITSSGTASGGAITATGSPTLSNIAVAVGQARIPTDIVLQYTVQSDGNDITIPAGAQAGDLMIFFASGHKNGGFLGPIWLAVDGTTAIVGRNVNSTNCKAGNQLYYMILNEDHPGTTLTRIADDTAHQLYIFRDANGSPITGAEIIAATSEADSLNNPADLSDTSLSAYSTDDDTILVIHAAGAADGAASMTTVSMTPTEDNVSVYTPANGHKSELSYRVWNQGEAKANITAADMGDEGEVNAHMLASLRLLGLFTKTAQSGPGFLNTISDITSSGVAVVKSGGFTIWEMSGGGTLTDITSSGVASAGGQTASGTPTLSAVTSSGVAERIVKGSGTPTLSAVTSNGDAEVVHPASGTPTIGNITSSATGTIVRFASGTPTIGNITPTGVAERVATASGTPTLSSITASGAAERILTASGAATITAITSTGVAERILLASGAATLSPITSTGVAERVITATGTPTLSAITSTGAASLRFTASGTTALTDVTASGAAERILTATGTPTISNITSSGAAKFVLAASGAATLSDVTASGSAKFVLAASGAPTLSAVTSSGSAKRKLLGTGTATLGAVTAAGVAERVVTASGTPALSNITSSGSASFVWVASGTPTVGNLTASGLASVSGQIIASGSPTVSAITSAAAVKLTRVATGAATLTDVTASGAAERILTASGAVTLTNITAAGSAERILTATGAATLGAVTSTGSAERILSASGAATLGAVTSTGAATVSGEALASGAVTLSAVTSSASVKLTRAASGTTALTDVTASGAATRIVTAIGSATLTNITSNGTATRWNSHTATGAATLSAVTSEGIASTNGQLIATGAATLGAVTATGAAKMIRKASGTPSVGDLSSTGVAERIVKAVGTPTVGDLSASGGSALVIRKASGTPSVGSPAASGVVKLTRHSSGTPSVGSPSPSAAVKLTRHSSGTPTIGAVTSTGVGFSGVLLVPTEEFVGTWTYSILLSGSFAQDIGLLGSWDSDIELQGEVD